ncbi:MAG: pilus assembly protein PilM, partial [Alphaproteobacteria bacterium]|nr:pilus assembly protein PilM [Alphaproteobacteria bacterium]
MNSSAGSPDRAAPFARFLRWWGRELRGLLPGPLARLLGLDPAFLLVELDGETLALSLQDGARRQQAGRLAPGQPASPALAGRVVVLRLPANEGLGKTLALPLAAEENLREVLEFEMERQTPFPADQVYFDWRVLERRPAERRLVLRLLVAPRARVEQALARLAASSLAPQAVDLGGEAAPPLDFNLLPALVRAPMPRRRG